MRKGQEYILNQAIAMKYSENLINILKREDLTINQLLYIYNYYYYQSEINSNSNFQIEEYCNFYNYFGCNYRKPTILSKDLNSYVKLCEKTKNNIIIEKPLNEISIWIDEKYTVRIECIKYYQTHLILNRDRINIYGMQKAMSKKLVIFNSGKIYEELGRTSKLVPISLKKLMDLKNFDNNMSQLIDIILNHAISENKLYEDIIKDFKLSQIIPIKFNDILKYHSKSEYLKDNYVLANSLPIKYNKLNINLSYLILKSYIYVDEKSKQKLLKIKDDSMLKENKYINDTVRLSEPLYKRKVRNFFNIYMNNYFQEIIFSKDFSENTLIIELDKFFNSLPDYQKDYLKEDFSEIMAYLSKNKIKTNKDKNYLLNKLSKIINLYIYKNFANKSRYKEKINLFL